MQTATTIIKELKRSGTPERARSHALFFKTKKGEYGHGDVFWGITVPEQRKIAKKYQDASETELKKLLGHPAHECRLTALLILVAQYEESQRRGKKHITDLYLSQTKNINNWDLVDLSAPYILGKQLLGVPPQKRRYILRRLALSKNIWKRRIAIVSTHAGIQNGEFDDTLMVANLLLRDTQDLIHKAAGWMLREVGKKDLATEERFLKKYAARMPRTMLRYAIEKFPEEKRKRYLAL